VSRFSAPKGGQAIVIGKGGKVQTAQNTSARKPSKAAQPKSAKPQGKEKPALGKPVQRINRARGRNGERSR
jgi:hypothetical protein